MKGAPLHCPSHQFWRITHYTATWVWRKLWKTGKRILRGPPRSMTSVPSLSGHLKVPKVKTHSFRGEGGWWGSPERYGYWGDGHSSPRAESPGFRSFQPLASLVLSSSLCYRMDLGATGSLGHCGFFAHSQGIGIIALNARVWWKGKELFIQMLYRFRVMAECHH